MFLSARERQKDRERERGREKDGDGLAQAVLLSNCSPGLEFRVLEFPWVAVDVVEMAKRDIFAWCSNCNAKTGGLSRATFDLLGATIIVYF